MLQVAVVTLFPEMLAAVGQFGVTGRAVQSGLLRITAFNPRDYAVGPHRNVDDRPYGGGPGMVMRPVFAAAKSRPGRVAYAEGEEERVLRAVQVVLDEGLARPILIGRKSGLSTASMNALRELLGQCSGSPGNTRMVRKGEGLADLT